ncbi:MAG TPA: cysteine desulfurase [Bacteroidales bacterium]|nr:cysteine desulfurase [Bacteroidales bacterium]HOH22546.1 cysteine desulfurase [Bacteroidales bacterium]HPZ02827.1 cysteine desulfurase [Bacteroidales bacterium]HQB74290.1 cysteine desulfurase [Bacteroidales bacterium]
MEQYRKDFKILDQMVYKRPLVYFDNAATTQKPQIVIDAISEYYENYNSNIHRGVHYLSQQATDQFEQARKTIQHYINAKHSHEIIFTKGTTESINLVAQTFGMSFLNPGDEVLISEMEHHANIVPWKMICDLKRATLKVIPMNEVGELEFDQIERLITSKTKILAITHTSNVLGTINPIKKIIQIAHSKGVPVLVDGAQAVSHSKVDVQELDADFYAFSGHKMYAPMGIGVLYGKEEWLNKLPPYQGGGEMIGKVTFEEITYNELPFKFEAGTPNVEGVLGLEKAIQYIQSIGIEKIANYEQGLLNYLMDRMKEIPNIHYYGLSKEKVAVLSFNVGDIHPYDLGVILDQMGIAVRTGHHCAQPIMDKFNIPGTIRVSLALYNTKAEIDLFMDALKKAITMLE